ncbi:hypothetical protein OAJ94_03920 [Deltaproteobacteria bacterium]|nr:hypothetical protein [Deltaproteobacteria bacterium]
MNPHISTNFILIWRTNNLKCLDADSVLRYVNSAATDYRVILKDKQDLRLM